MTERRHLLHALHLVDRVPGAHKCRRTGECPPQPSTCHKRAKAYILLPALSALIHRTACGSVCARELYIGVEPSCCFYWFQVPQTRTPRLLVPRLQVPNKGVALPNLDTTAFAISFAWAGQVGTLIGGFITFLYLDFIGSCITFVSLGSMSGEHTCLAPFPCHSE